MSAEPTTAPVLDEPEDTETEAAPARIRLPRFNFQTMQEELVPVDNDTAAEVLRFVLTSSAWHDDVDLLRRKARKWKETIYDTGWETVARRLRAQSPQKWTYARIARKLGVTRTAVKALFGEAR